MFEEQPAAGDAPAPRAPTSAARSAAGANGRCLPAGAPPGSCGSRCWRPVGRALHRRAGGASASTAATWPARAEAVSVGRLRRATRPQARAHQRRPLRQQAVVDLQPDRRAAGCSWSLPEPAQISRVVWSRDRSPKPQYSDRLATAIRDRRVARRQALDDRRHACRPAAARLCAAARQSGRSRWPPGCRRMNWLSVDVLRTAGGRAARSSSRRSPRCPGLCRQLRQAARDPPPLPRRPDAAPRGGAAGQPHRTLAAAWQLAADAPEQERRRALADWIASPANPLTRPGDRQPALALSLRHRHRRHAERLWRQRWPAQPPANCLTGWRANSRARPSPSRPLAAQANPPADRHQPRLSPDQHARA